MRAVLQRVTRASVTVGDRVVGSIGPGICVLVGISQDDTKDDMEYIARKVLGLRVFNKDLDMWKASVQDAQLEVLCVSQFTLYGKTTKGMKPDFHSAMKSDTSRQFFDDFVALLGPLVNDGPVTLQLDSRKFSYDAKDPEQAAKDAAKLATKEQRRSKFDKVIPPSA
ncbi:D-tyrosyl-tRNA(Tyr) deacylase [Coemansia sp. RSA 1287]|nr:D-tyrosyl-tRNA(Tyr) deacylase [Coemansia sp. RSA 1287]